MRCGVWNVEDPGGLIYQMTDWQAFQWLAYDDLSPISDERGDLQAGIVTSSVVNELRMLQAITRAAHGDKDPKFETTSPGDFMPLVYRKPKAKPVEPPTTTSQWNAFKASVRSMGEGMKKGTVQ